MSSNADIPRTSDGRTYHLATAEHVLPAHCLVTGNPARATYIARNLLERVEQVSFPGGREFRCYAGLYCGDGEPLPVGIVTHGMGSGTMGTTIVEAHASGARRFIRVGSCSTFVPDAKPGDLAIIDSAIRWDGASDEMLDPCIPAVSDLDVLLALKDAARDLGYDHHVGMGATSSTFYHGQGRPDANGYVSPQMQARIQLLRDHQAVSFEMETATLLAWAISMGGRRQGVMAGAVHAIYANRSSPNSELVKAQGDMEAVKTALLALELLSIQFPLQS